jgi:ABC-type methionine transport system ATPase subunit
LEGTVEELFLSDHDALSKLITRPRFEVRAGKTLLRISVTESEREEDILCAVGKVCGVSYRLRYADMSAFKRGFMGHLYIEIDTAGRAKTAAYLTARGVAYREEEAARC